MIYSSSIPASNEYLKSQDTTTDVNDEFFQKLFAPPSFLQIHRIFQVACFFIFLGPIKLFLSFLSFILWMLALTILPVFQRFFRAKLKFKLWSHSICKYFIRLFLLCLGVIRIKIDGDIDPDVRFYVSNYLTLLDFLVHFCTTPLTIVKTSDTIGIERFVAGSIFDVFRLRPSKRRVSYQITNCVSDPSYFPILIFPEGSPTNGNAVTGFAVDYFESEYATQPVALKYNLYLTPKGFNSLYWDDKNIIGLLFRILSTPFITVNLAYLKKQDMKNGILEPLQCAKMCQLKIANELGALAASKVVPTKLTKTQ